MQGLMMDMPLLISGLIQYAADYHGEAEIVAREIEGDIHRYTYAEAHPRIKRMALALKRLGMKPGDRVGTLAWNTHRHFEMFYAAPGMGYVLHTVNPRLFPEQLVYIINHAEDRLLFIDRATLPIVEVSAEIACHFDILRLAFRAQTAVPLPAITRAQRGNVDRRFAGCTGLVSFR